MSDCYCYKIAMHDMLANYVEKNLILKEEQWFGEIIFVILLNLHHFFFLDTSVGFFITSNVHKKCANHNRAQLIFIKCNTHVTSSQIKK